MAVFQNITTLLHDFYLSRDTFFKLMFIVLSVYSTKDL